MKRLFLAIGLLLAVSSTHAATSTIFARTLEPNPATGDELLIEKAGDGPSRKITIGSIISGQTEVVAAPGDHIAIIDATDSTLKKALVSTIGGVTSVFTRTGAVIVVSGDYTASEVTNVAAGDIIAITVQAALDELDTEKLPLAGGAMTGAITTTSTFDGRDVAADGVTADAALPRVGGQMTGNITMFSTETVDSRNLSVDGTKLDGIEDNAKNDQIASEVVSTPAGGIAAAQVQAALDELDTEKAALAGAAFTGAITTTSTFDGRTVATDGTKLDTIEGSADVTDTVNVTAALPVPDSTSLVDFATGKAMRIDVGAIANTTVRVLTMPDEDIDLTPGTGSFATEAEGNLAVSALPKGGGQMTGNITMAASETVDGRDLSVDGTKLDTIEGSADITDAINVDAAGAVMETDYNAQTVLIAVSNDTPAPVTVTASSFVGRKATGNAGIMSAAESRTVLNVEDNSAADQVASEVVSTPAGDIAANQVQAALDELDTEKAALAGASFTGAVDIDAKLTVNDLVKDSITTTLAMTDGVVTGIFPAVEPGVPDNWRFNSAASWYTESRNTGTYLGEAANIAACEAITGAVINDYCYETTGHTYINLDDLSGGGTEIFRAGSAEFPARPMFVNRTAKLVDILDGKDGSLWARAEGNASDLLNNNGTMGAVTYRNGVMAVASTTGVFIVDFKDGGSLRFYTATNVSKYDGDWAQRNAGNGYVVISTDPILSNTVKAVAIDDASAEYGFDKWGVPTSLIAVLCSGPEGISFIHPDGNVYDFSTGTAVIKNIGFDHSGALITNNNNPTRTISILPHPRDTPPTKWQNRRTSFDTNTNPDFFPHHWGFPSGVIQLGGVLDLKEIMFDTGGISAARQAISVIEEDPYSSDDDTDGRNSLASYIGHDAILSEHFIASLMDRFVTSALGTEIGTSDLVESNIITGDDSTFTTTIGNWTKSTDSTLTVDTNRGKLTVDVSGSQYMNLSNTTVIGQAYVARFTYVTDSITGDLTLQAGTSANGSQNGSTTVSVVGEHSVAFIATATTTHISIKTDAGAQAAESIIVDDFELGIATHNRSQLGGGRGSARIRGTITRTAYDSGDVVMHSGADALSANAGSYLEVGYDGFATDGEIFHQWIDYTATNIRNLMSNRALNGSDDPITWLADNTAGSALYIHSDSKLYVRDGTGAANTATELSTAMATGLHEIRVILSSTDIYVYIDGKLNKVTASVTLTAPADAITYIHPSNSTLFRVGGIDRKGTAIYYQWTYDKERRLFVNGAKASLQGTGNVVDVAVDPIRNEYTVLQINHRTTFDMDNIVASDAAVSNTGISVSTYDGDISVLDGANLTLITRTRSVSNHLVHGDRVKEKWTIEFDSLVEADARIFGTSFSNPPVTGGNTVGGTLLDWDGSEGGAASIIPDGMLTMFKDQAGDYLLSLTVANRGAGSVEFEFSGTSGAARSTNATFTETLTYDPAASASDDVFFTPASSFDGQVSDYRIRPVGVPFWLEKGWRPETVYFDGVKFRLDTPDLVRDYTVTRRFDGSYGVEATTDTWNTISLEVIEQ